jgi:predicted double-glycine peptidase
MNIKWKILSLFLLLSLVMIPLGVYSVDTNNSSQNGTNTTILDNNNLSHNNTTILKVPDLLQPAANSTGPTALQAVLSYYGTNVGIDELVNMTNNTLNGTTPQNIANTATQLGFTSEVRENMSLVILQQYIDQGIPVIVNIQAGVGKGSENFNWTADQSNGEYMVVVGVDSQNVYLEDPTMLGSVGYIPNQEFLDRWHNTFQNGNNSTTNSTNITNNQLGIIISGTTAPSNPLFLRIN